MPRPRKQDDMRKDIRLSLRVTAAEADALLAAAEEKGLSMTDVIREGAPFFREPLMEQRRRRPRQPVQHADELAAVLRQVGKIGSNINQLARVANMGSWPAAEELQEARAQIEWIRERLLAALSGAIPEGSAEQ